MKIFGLVGLFVIGFMASSVQAAVKIGDMAQYTVTGVKDNQTTVDTLKREIKTCDFSGTTCVISQTTIINNQTSTTDKNESKAHLDQDAEAVNKIVDECAASGFVATTVKVKSEAMPACVMHLGGSNDIKSMTYVIAKIPFGIVSVNIVWKNDAATSFNLTDYAFGTIIN